MDSQFDPVTKLLHRPDKMEAFLDRFDTEPPVGIEISPTNACNASCPWCFYVGERARGKHSDEELEWDTIEKLIEDLSPEGVESITWTGGGDPSVYRHIDDAIVLASKRGLKQGMFTNGYVAVNEPWHLSWIRITVTDSYVLSKYVVQYARHTEVGVNYNLCESNKQHLRPMFDAALEAGVKYFQVRPALANSLAEQELAMLPEWLLTWDDPRIKVELTPYKWRDYRKPHGYALCHGHRIVPFIWSNGDVAVCAYHRGDERYVFGNLYKESWLEIWEGKRRSQMLIDGVKVIPTCQVCCKLHEINKAMAAEPKHPEFI